MTTASTPRPRRSIPWTVLAATAIVVVGALVARGITANGPMLPVMLARAGQRVTLLPPLSTARAFTAWQGDVVYDVGVALAAALYLGGARSYRRRVGQRWPLRRTATFLLGLALLVITLNSAIAVYDMTLFSAHMIEHLMLIMVVPAFLVLGRPLTMLLATRPDGRLRRLVDRRWFGLAFAAPSALGLYTAVIVGTHLTGAMGLVMDHPWAGQLEHLLYLVSGVVFFAAVVGNAPVRWRLSYPGRLLVAMFTMVVDAFVGIVLLQSNVAIATLPHPGWGPSPLADTHIGGGLMWVVGDGLMALVPIGLYIAWARHSEARAETPGWYERARVGQLLANTAEPGGPAPAEDIDTGIDADEQQFQAYNRWLASLDQRR